MINDTLKQIEEEFDEKFLEKIHKEVSDYVNFVASTGKINLEQAKSLSDNCLIGGMDTLSDYFNNFLKSSIKEILEGVKQEITNTIGINTNTLSDEVVYVNGIDKKEYINKLDTIYHLENIIKQLK